MPSVSTPQTVRHVLAQLDRAIAATVIGLAGVFSAIVLVNLPLR